MISAVFHSLVCSRIVGSVSFARIARKSPMQKPLGAIGAADTCISEERGHRPAAEFSSAAHATTLLMSRARTSRWASILGRGRWSWRLVYYHCGLLCPQVLHGMAEALRGSRFKAGDQYDVLVASFDPMDTTADSVEAKQRFMATLGDAGTPDRRAFPHRPAAVHYRSGAGYGLPLRARARAGRQNGPVRALQRHHDRHA